MKLPGNTLIPCRTHMPPNNTKSTPTNVADYAAPDKVFGIDFVHEPM
jgi:hypothetical protein